MDVDPDTLRSDALRDSWTRRIAAADDASALEALRIAALGKSGEVTSLLKTMGSLSPEERQERGPRIHALREAVSSAIVAKIEASGSNQSRKTCKSCRLVAGV